MEAVLSGQVDREGIDMYRVRIRETGRYSTPDDPRGRMLYAGEWMTCQYVDWPGKPFDQGTAGYFAALDRGEEPVHDSWSFWTSRDIDAALIFGIEKISEVQAQDTPENRALFEGAPFPVDFVKEEHNA
jgi:hypothetical protein